MKKQFVIMIGIMMSLGCSTASSSLLQAPKQTAVSNISSIPIFSPALLTPTLPSTSLPVPTSTPVSYNGPVKIFGYIKDESGKPIKANIAFDAFGLGDQGFVTTDSNG
jgi:hypothetical protein